MCLSSLVFFKLNLQFMLPFYSKMINPPRPFSPGLKPHSRELIQCQGFIAVIVLFLFCTQFTSILYSHKTRICHSTVCQRNTLHQQLAVFNFFTEWWLHIFVSFGKSLSHIYGYGSSWIFGFQETNSLYILIWLIFQSWCRAHEERQRHLHCKYFGLYFLSLTGRNQIRH